MKQWLPFRHFSGLSLNPLQEVGVMKPVSKNGNSILICLNPLQEVGVMKHWLWEAPSLLAWQGHLRTVALKHTHGFGQHGHYG